REFVVVPIAQRTYRDFIGDVAVTPDGRLLYAADLYHDAIVVINPSSGRVIEHFKTGRRPYRILFHPGGKSYYVSSWADGTVYQHETATGNLLGQVRLGQHPTDMVWSARKAAEEPGETTQDKTAAPWAARLFVAAANTNNVYVVGIGAGDEMEMIEAINVATSPMHPLGMTPSALALNRDETRLYVVCSDANAVAVVDVSTKESRVQGFVPTGWYPTAVRSLADGRLVVLNGRGLGSHPNPKGPSPYRKSAPIHQGNEAVEYVGRIQKGTASFIAPFDDDRLEAYSKTAIEASPYNDRLLQYVPTGPNNPIPPDISRRSPIEHVIYIVKENRTYDQVLGDIGRGNSDPSLVLFSEKYTPNQHKIAREFVLFDNFYVNSDVSADGHNWATAAIAPDYVQKLWPNSYAKRRNHYDYEGQDIASLPPAGYLWTNAAAAGRTVRNYGYFVQNRAKPASDGTQVESVRDRVLAPVTNLQYRGFDLDYPDVERAKVFLHDLAQFESAGTMPQLIVMRLGNDHTAGTAPGKLSPLSLAADNDYAIGMIAEAVSKSKFWGTTAIFIVEDDAQNGPDHVDSHRSPAYLISPYLRRGVVDSTLYNQTSVLRTMELILAMRPMTHFDAGARPMSAAFQPTPDLTPFTAEKPRVPLDDRNPANSATSERSARMNFTEADEMDDNDLNDILYRSIRGIPAPAPTHSYFAR
ncbi:MAG TPA: alkaline phosphatase family protein, partial [Bryobacteraceae bacterium]|nr:alkaline phosphatase family protein [Bryobacteraceae bacterium]